MRLRRIFVSAGVVLAGSIVAAVLTGYLMLRGSLAQLDGTRSLSALHAAVRITRDWRGVPTIEAGDRADLAFATGFVHAQDRYFQMDLSRRLAAGELAQLLGPAVLDADMRTRPFRFRSVAHAVVAEASPVQRALLEAYVRGVNAGLDSLAARPWEYWLLGQAPARWTAEDSVLVIYSMWWDLQANGFRREIMRHKINAQLGGPDCPSGWKCALAFLYPRGSDWDAPVLAGATLENAPIPDASVLDVRDGPPAPPLAHVRAQPLAGGSNNWALAAPRSASGAALVANDMHLGQRVPPVWYHARLKVVPRQAQDEALDLNGVTLAGTPVLVAGSNGHIAWGFTNSYGTWLTVTPRDCETDAAGTPHLAAGSSLAVTYERIRVHGAADVTLAVRSAPEGLLLAIDSVRHTCWFGAWLAELPAATNLNLTALERVTSTAQALTLAPVIGIPHQNAVVGDQQGHIGWTIFGRVPLEVGAARARAGVTFTGPTEHPQILDPPADILWSANARVSSDARQEQLIGADLAALGAEYDLGARARQIRDDLLSLGSPATPADMLRIQLDDRALFLARWRELLLGLLDEQALDGHRERAEFRRLVAQWDARAEVTSVGYRLVRSFRDHARQAVWDMLLTALGIAGDEDIGPPAQFEAPLWQLLQERPAHLLARPYADWPAFLRAVTDSTIADLEASCGQLARCSWGRHNLVGVRHPLSGALPWLARFLDMPPLELAGDHDMPRVQDGAFGASERFAVSPGHEAEGYLLIAGGQSGHPLSSFYRAGFTEWARGERLPFLPGPAHHALTLTPQ